MDRIPAGSSARAAELDSSLDVGASFIDRLLDGIRRLPFGGWWVYPLLLVLVGVWVSLVRWLTGSAPIGQVDPAILAYFPYPVVALGLLHYLDDVAADALRSFAPALGDDASIAAWRRRLTTLPPQPTNLVAIAGLVFGCLALVQLPPAIYRQLAPDLLTLALLVGWLAIAGFVVGAVLLYQSWRQLRAVSAIHAAASLIDPARPEPLFSFSRLTARTGLAYLGVVYYSLVTNGPTYAGDPTVLVLNALFGSFALACFVLPLRGMHRRLVVAKRGLLEAADRRIERVRVALYAAVDRDELEGMADFDDALGSLGKVKAEVEKLPTWPWSPALFRGFVTALLLPIVIWFVTRLLESALLR